MTYYSKLKKFWAEFGNYQQLPGCDDCATISAILKEREEEKVYQFLIGLDDVVFGTVRSSIIQQILFQKKKKGGLCYYL